MALAACQPFPGATDSVLTRWAVWFQVLDGGDIRRACAVGTDRLRLVYNGTYAEQIRLFESTRTAAGGRYDARVIQDQGIGLSGAVSFDLAFPAAPFRPAASAGPLAAAEWNELLSVLRADGLGRPPPVGAELNSWEFFWVAAACVDGRFQYQAWRQRDPGFARLRFPVLAARLDRTGIPINPARTTNAPGDAAGELPYSRAYAFSVRVAANGLWGLP